MTKKTMATIGAWILAAAASVWLGSTFVEPTAKAAPVVAQEAPKPAPAPEKAHDEPAPLEIPITIVASKPRPAPKAVHVQAAPCNDGETREVGALWNAKPGSGQGAWGSRTVTLRCH